jgi:predicted 3-demethylubiquinone-9 3-methyltransferase (glyoxalase superfamily)
MTTRITQRITPFLWFDDKAEEGAKFYASVFKNSKIDKVTRYPEEAAKKIGREPGSVMTVEFTLDGVEFVALNAGPQFKFTEALSFVVMCDTQDEVDYYWEKLTADGGEPGVCSWLKDKFGLSWQVQPRLLIQLLGDPDKAKAERVMNAMMEMTKIDISKLKKAYDGK